MDWDLVRGIRSRGVDVLTAAGASMIRRTDEQQLDMATIQGRVLYSFNIGDFHEIHTRWTATGRTMRESFWLSRSGFRPANKFGDCCA
jgi:hypothetical protein